MELKKAKNKIDQDRKAKDVEIAERDKALHKLRAMHHLAVLELDEFQRLTEELIILHERRDDSKQDLCKKEINCLEAQIDELQLKFENAEKQISNASHREDQLQKLLNVSRTANETLERANMTVKEENRKTVDELEKAYKVINEDLLKKLEISNKKILQLRNDLSQKELSMEEAGGNNSREQSLLSQKISHISVYAFNPVRERRATRVPTRNTERAPNVHGCIGEVTSCHQRGL